MRPGFPPGAAPGRRSIAATAPARRDRTSQRLSGSSRSRGRRDEFQRQGCGRRRPRPARSKSANDVVMPWMVEDPIMPSRPTMEVSAVAPWSVLARTETMRSAGSSRTRFPTRSHGAIRHVRLRSSACAASAGPARRHPANPEGDFQRPRRAPARERRELQLSLSPMPGAVSGDRPTVGASNGNSQLIRD